MRMDLGFFFNPKDEEQRDSIKKSFGRFGYKYARFKEAESLHTIWEVKVPKSLSYMIGAMKFFSKVWDKDFFGNPAYKDSFILSNG